MADKVNLTHLLQCPFNSSTNGQSAAVMACRGVNFSFHCFSWFQLQVFVSVLRSKQICCKASLVGTSKSVIGLSSS